MILGGHSIINSEIKFGKFDMAVIGVIHPERVQARVLQVKGQKSTVKC